MNEIETYEALSRGEKVPRKEKLLWLGRKLSKKKLREKIENWKLKSPEKQSISYFCPNCGCSTGYSHCENVDSNKILINEYCLRCHTLTAWTDNSPWHFTLNNL